MMTKAAEVFNSKFAVPKMDCPSEENLIRMAIEGSTGLLALQFDLSQREVTVKHTCDVQEVLKRLEPLGLGASLISSSTSNPSSATEEFEADNEKEASLLKLLLIINGVMFITELALGLWAESTGLIADSLDMFADAAVYGVALYAVGRAASIKLKAAHLAGWLQVLLAIGVLSEVVRRFIYGSEPVSILMISVGFLALLANTYSLILIAKHRHYGAHMKASYIFSANDVIANLGVIIAGALVYWTGSAYPDLVIGFIIAVIVLLGAKRILQMR